MKFWVSLNLKSRGRGGSNDGFDPFLPILMKKELRFTRSEESKLIRDGHKMERKTDASVSRSLYLQSWHP
ncbi:hypothetical protein O6P43_026626 [Quillaja saponaria]|uniref:Uncharacterized protein n=1 Tax=Quillaja saponaria TaxID=32244 RepID=A0AAD7L2Q3_QUISA|nr:hypothetical protein O6P43_026626 [Quillaja saponaria]